MGRIGRVRGGIAELVERVVPESVTNTVGIGYQRAQGMVEYAVIVALVAVAAIAGVTAFGGTIVKGFQHLQSQFGPVLGG
jgi:Flp pilus assembly pilin Flp